MDNEKIAALDKDTTEPQEFLTTQHGVRIGDNQNSLKAGVRGPTLLEDFVLREKITHFDHERIPERVVHARGSAAHGYFQVYESMKEFSKAQFLTDPSVKTPVFVRFSTVAGFRGSADTVRDVRGFATRFYTKEGNFDLVGNNMPVFFIQDAIKFPDVIHAVKPEPHNEIPQASSAHDNFWDFISLSPESMHMVMWVISDRALPRSYSMMEGFGVHTFRLVNEQNKSRFVKFHWKPLNGVHSMLFEETQIIAGKDPDFNRRDLWESIEKGNFPEWELGVQILEEDELDRIEFDILDPTKLWPEEDVPVKIIGKMTLNRNPDNFFAETEQVAFGVGNIVPGIDFTNDPLMQGRLFSYVDTQLIRLGGPNFQEIPINRPIAAVSNNQRDGHMRQTINRGKINYEPNSLGGGCPMQATLAQRGFVSYAERMDGTKVREKSESFGDHYTQATLFWNSMSPVERHHIVLAFQFELSNVSHMHIREKMVDHLNHINHELAVEVAKGIAVKAPEAGKARNYTKTSPALSIENHKTKTIKGRKIAILVGEGDASNLKKWCEEKGASADVIAIDLGQPGVNKSFLISSSVMYDAVLVANSNDALLKSGDAIKFVNEAYRHCKAIGAIGDGVKLLEASSVKSTSAELGIIVGDEKAVLGEFYVAVAKHRHWNRLDISSIPA